MGMVTEDLDGGKVIPLMAFTFSFAVSALLLVLSQPAGAIMGSPVAVPNTAGVPATASVPVRPAVVIGT